MSLQDNYTLLVGKLDEFIRKYYKNQLIRGGLLFVSVFVLFFLILALAEYAVRFGTLTRTLLFYIYLAITAYILLRLILIPLLKLLRMGKVITHEQAAEIIGQHFPEVSDKLLNTLQLKKMGEGPDADRSELIRASVDQKILQLRPVSFKTAIDLKKNRKYLPYAIPPVLLLLLLLVSVPRVITEPAGRIVNYAAVFTEPPPFWLNLASLPLEAIQQEDFILDVTAEGSALPAEVLIETGGNSYLMTRKSPALFRFNFKNLQHDIVFSLKAGPYQSEEYTLRVMPRPIVLNFDIALDYPAYTGKNDETLENTGDLVIPEGTKATWKFYTRDTRNVLIRMGEVKENVIASGGNTFSISKTFTESMLYSIMPENEFMRSNRDSISYSISVVKDAYPVISVEQEKDSVFDKRIYFTGGVRDDYGFSKLAFNIRKINADEIQGEEFEESVYSVPVSGSQVQQQFFYSFDIDSISTNPGDQLAYHFTVWDNDGVNGPKSSRSGDMIFRVPTEDEIAGMLEEENDRIKEALEQMQKDSRVLQKKIEDINRSLIEKEKIGWKEKEQIEQILEDHQSLQDKIDMMQEENRQKDLREQKLRNLDEELVRKQEQLQNLLDQLMTEELKKMIEELKSLLEEVDKDKVSEMLEKMKMDTEALEKELDRNLELFKQLEFEKLLQENIDNLRELAKKQQELADKTKSEGREKIDLKAEQEKLNREFEKLQENLQEMQEKNRGLEQPNALMDTKKQEEEIGNDMKESIKDLEEGKPADASGKQKGASGKMDKLASDLEQNQSDMYSEEMGEDIGDLREILENLIQLSFDQEELISRTTATPTLDPQYVRIIEDQKRVKDDLVMVEDSLWALSRRVPLIEPYITREIADINHNVERSLENLNDRRKGPALEGQQYAMTSINDLALMLAEALEQMMMNAEMQSSGQCKKGMPKPGSGKASPKNMREMQQKLNQQIQKAKEGLSKGKSQNNQGEKQSMSQELVRMAAEQEAIRKMMEQYREEMSENGIGVDKDLKELMEMMEQNETEIVNKMITQETIERLKDIETRLLKHEKAELKREEEEKRESREAKNENYSNPEDFFEYNKLRSKEEELLKTVPPGLKPFYKNKVNAYFYNVESK
jgi:hypothetical protein